MNNYQVKAIKEKTQQYLSKRKFEDALTFITKTIEQEPNPTIDLFELRAQVYEKSGQYSQAELDAKRMIHLNARNARGYLRLGKLLQLDGFDKKADQLYTQGLRMVHKMDPLRPVLKKVSQRLNERILRTRPVLDLFRILPREVLLCILQQLNFKSIVQCMQVCKHWRDCIKKEPSLFCCLDFSCASPRSVNSRDRNVMAVARYSVYSKDNIQEVIGLEKLGILTPTKALLRSVKSLKVYKTISPLHTQSTDKLYTIWTPFSELHYFYCATPITFSIASKILSCCKKLKQVELVDLIPDLIFDSMDWDKLFNAESVPLALKSLTFIRNQKFPFHHKEQQFLKDLLSASPYLEYLEASYQSDLVAAIKKYKINLRSLIIIDEGVSNTVKDLAFLPQSLTTLIVKPCNPASTILCPYLFPTNVRMESLINLELFLYLRLSQNDIDNVVKFLTSCYKLKKLVLHDSLALAPHFFEIFASLPELEHLEIPDNVALQNKHAIHITDCCPNLKYVNFSNSISLDGSGFIAVLRGLKELKRIDIINCDSVSRDAIDWARSKGMQVTVASSLPNSQPLGTKKIRLI
ncbi:F-box/TPR repeat protein pof3 [Schizosaccharomyces pombe]|uniref:F-box/TPR repeat protein pof3 n=1 Tax=Schizosaccharomyces pombe (strain 972 / ATCC 24843) TaxID=284812 RepID=POF3_SCHPO|nr:F-box protein Pof3 [Schizosaccharomyces pombe]O74991.1 RecName: Full=F-box/TPR repeat protein pof3 [Schizosaccharomyces pombe 972h-]BAA84529.1 Pof3 [Schizosaccharomyces pombe]CAA19347.1 F-box protein Pof3 [Schizosaccharomyces pombe]|eukprot:NP_588152.1 F-box protein Pof3 [Schizosaccharomyces pombe]